MKLYNRDALQVLTEIPENSIDLIVTDPPYRCIGGGVNHIGKVSQAVCYKRMTEKFLRTTIC